ncbi:hypothetical protein [Phycicoccus sp. 3266]|uniref:hypothetical protein n=1 Tax=Phycicoccus sp. 3266 TaxID=2817751 RepID=UPI002864E0DC|nr:hypothetical protein [Phycicoccus sp. 3266]MDR6861965.1 hypothetical protein [Phycicoccus sp. 3266]
MTRVFDAHAARRQDLETRITDLVVADFERFDGWYSTQLVDEVTKQVAAKLAAGQRGIAGLTDAYLARVTSYVLGRTVTGSGVPLVMGQTLRMGVKDHEEVYGRVAAEYRYQRYLGNPDSAALTTALTRAREMVGTDLGLAHQHQVRRFNEARNVTRYRRVIRSEKACGLCAAASDRIYYRGDLMPIHSRCRCGVIAVTANTDPGSQLNEDTLRELYKAAGSTRGPDLKRVRVEVFEHGELGPQLRVAGQHIRGPEQVAAVA